MTDETADYKIIEDKKQEMSSIFSRMDKDENLYFLVPYKMMQLPPNDGKEMPDTANITLNDPLLFANKAIAIMGGATMQTVVEGRDMSDKQTTKIEEFLDDFFYMLDEWLVKRSILGLDSFINEQICIRGRIVARTCIRVDKAGNLIPDVLPLDAKSFVYDIDDKGLIWGAPTFSRSKAQIEREYGKRISSEFGEVVDFWDAEKNVVFVDREIIKEQANPYGYPPFVLAICPIGSMFNTVNAKEHEGESILWANRNLWQEKNRTATILQTLNIATLFGGLQYESSKGEAASKPEESPYGVRKVHPVEKGGGYKPMPISDIRSATRLFYSILEASLQKGSLSVIDYGTLTFPLSAIAITRLTGQRDDIFLPRIQAKATFYQILSRMVINQCIALKKSFELGQLGSRNTYRANDLKGDYTIKYRFFTLSKEQDIADLSIANAAQGFLSGDTIRREVLKLKNPDGEKTKFLSEQAEKADEVLFLYRRASELIEDEKPLEAYILGKRIVTLLRQRQMQDKLTEAKEKPDQATRKGLLPLLGAGGGGQGGGGQGRVPPEPTEETEVGKTEEV